MLFFFFNDTATTEIYTLSYTTLFRSEMKTSRLRLEIGQQRTLADEDESRRGAPGDHPRGGVHEIRVADRKSTRLNSSHSQMSPAVLCLKKKFASAAALASSTLSPL